MANYSLILDTKFKPFSYQEMLAPVAASTQAHQALEEEYSELAAKANVWEKMANEQTDSKAYKMYKTYADDLSARADDLMKYGLNVSSRKGMLDMRARYSKEIVPIEVAYKRRDDLAKEQRDAMKVDSTLRYQRYAREMSLDDFIDDPSLDYGKSYSGELLAKQVSQVAANYAKVLTREGGLESLGLPYQYKSRIGYGATPEEILAVINDAALKGHEGAIKFLKGARDQVLQSSGVLDWTDPDSETRKFYISSANRGLFSALGQTTLKNYTDSYSMQSSLNAEQRAYQEEVDKKKKLGLYNTNPTSLYGTSEVAAKNKSTLDTLNKWISKGYFNNKGQLTGAGLKALRGATWKTKQQRGPTGYIETKVKVGDWEFKNWALSHGHSQAGINAGYGSPTLNKYFQDTMAAINSGQLVTGTPNIDVYRQGIRDKTDQDYMLKKVTAALAGGNIYQAGDLSVTDKGITMSKGKGISSTDFKKLATDNPILYIINSPTTNNQLIELSDGTKYIMPKGIMDNINQANISEANTRLTNSGSLEESANLLNQSNSYLGSLLNYNEGTGISTNDGMIIF